MAVAAVKVTGDKEFIRAAIRAERAAGTSELVDRLKQIAEPVRESAQQKISRYRQVGQARVYRRGFRVDVAQSHRRVTGKRGDFGALQMRRGFLPALREHEDRIRDEAREWIEGVAASSGL